MRLLNDEINETFLQTLVCEEFDVKWPELTFTKQEGRIGSSTSSVLVALPKIYRGHCHQIGKRFWERSYDRAVCPSKSK
jgi:hypothetical protein